MNNFFQLLGITEVEWRVLRTIAVAPELEDALVCRILNGSDGLLNESEIRTSLKACLTKGLARKVDDAALRQIRTHLRGAIAVGEPFRYPILGDIDLSPEGVALFLKISEGDGKVVETYVRNIVRTDQTLFASKNAATEWVAKHESDQYFHLTGPIQTGPWRGRWWERYEIGFLTTEQCSEPTLYDFQSRDENESLATVVGTPAWQAEAHLRRMSNDEQAVISQGKEYLTILDKHGVSPGEWCVLLTLNSRLLRHDTERWLVRNAFKHGGNAIEGVSIQQSDVETGLSECKKRELIQIMDENTAASINAMLSRDLSCTLAIEQPRVGVIDFTITGASVFRPLYEELYGEFADWELWYRNHNFCYNTVSYKQEVYRKVHLYTSKELSREEMFRECFPDTRTAAGWSVVNEKSCFIGPWCVYWWKPQTAGFRVELELLHEHWFL